MTQTSADLRRKKICGNPSNLRHLRALIVFNFQLVKSETTVKDGFDLVQNRFFIKGEGEILYNYNHGHLAADPKTAAA